MLRYVVYAAALALGACAGMHVEVPATLDAGSADSRSRLASVPHAVYARMTVAR